MHFCHAPFTEADYRGALTRHPCMPRKFTAMHLLQELCCTWKQHEWYDDHVLSFFCVVSFGLQSQLDYPMSFLEQQHSHCSNIVLCYLLRLPSRSGWALSSLAIDGYSMPRSRMKQQTAFRETWPPMTFTGEYCNFPVGSKKVKKYESPFWQFSFIEPFCGNPKPTGKLLGFIWKQLCMLNFQKLPSSKPFIS